MKRQMDITDASSTQMFPLQRNGVQVFSDPTPRPADAEAIGRWLDAWTKLSENWHLPEIVFPIILKLLTDFSASFPAGREADEQDVPTDYKFDALWPGLAKEIDAATCDACAKGELLCKCHSPIKKHHDCPEWTICTAASTKLRPWTICTAASTKLRPLIEKAVRLSVETRVRAKAEE